MLTEIRLQNYKAFGEPQQSIRLGKVNVFIGSNGTGKSSVLQALQVLAQALGLNRVEPRPTGNFKFSTYLDLVHKREPAGTLKIGFAGRAFPPLGKALFDYEVAFSSDGFVGQQTGVIAAEQWPAFSSRLELKSVYKYGDRMVEPKEVGSQACQITLDAGDAICQPIRIGGGRQSDPSNRQDFESLNNALRNLLDCYRNAIRKVFVIGALRGFESLSYQLTGAPNEYPGEAREVASTFAYRREVESKVSGWIERITGTKVEIHLVPNMQAELRSADGYNIYHEGFGTNQLVRPFLQIAIAPPDSLIAIEEAEIHLHPSAQTKLCDVLADICQKENQQIVLTTHSDHILTGFLNLVAEGKLEPQDLSVWYFEKTDKQASAYELKVDEKGMLEGGLKGFFEVELEKAERHISALNTRRAKG